MRLSDACNVFVFSKKQAETKKKLFWKATKNFVNLKTMPLRMSKNLSTDQIFDAYKKSSSRDQVSLRSRVPYLHNWDHLLDFLAVWRAQSSILI